MLSSSIRILNCYTANAILSFTTCFIVSEIHKVLRDRERFSIHTFKIRRDKFFFKKLFLKRQEKNKSHK